MPIIKITKEEMLKGQPFPVGWYPGTLVKFDIESNKAGDGINYIPSIQFIHNGEEKIIKTWFSNKAINNIVPFYEACTGKRIDRKGELEFDTDEIKLGTRLLVGLIQEPYQGRIQNKMNNFLPADAQVPF